MEERKLGQNDTIGIIMSVYNEKPIWLKAAVDSILSQTYSNFQYYILLDHPDNVELKELLREYQRKDRRIHVYENEENVGLVNSLNQLIAMTKEPYIARMDADDVSRPERLEKELQFLKEQDLDFVASGMDYLDEEGRVSVGDSIPELNAWQVQQCSKYGNVLIHSSWLLKREVYVQVGGYRNCTYCEDYDLILRALQRQVKIGRLEEHLLQYRIRNGSITLTHAIEQDEKVNYLRKCYKEGKQIDAIDIEELNRRFEHLSDREKMDYSRAKHQIDQIAQCLYRKEIGTCLGIFVKGTLSNHYFRSSFRKKFRNKIKLERIYKLKNGE